MSALLPDGSVTMMMMKGVVIYGYDGDDE